MKIFTMIVFFLGLAGVLSATITDLPYQHWEYTFENQNGMDKWHWMSYPVLNTIADNAQLASEFFEELLHIHQSLIDGELDVQPTYLDEVRWYNQGPYKIFWAMQSWNDISCSHIVTSPQGYKIKLQTISNPGFSLPLTVFKKGLKTPDSTQFSIYGGMENWLGYFKEDAAKPEEAFRAIWDDITMIRAKNWCLLRDESNGELVGKSGLISFGDMVIVTTYNDHKFRWGNASPDTPSMKKTPDSFVFDEKPDYIPVYLSFPDSLVDIVSEVGVYVNGTCKGAVVVEDSFEQISTYVDSAEELIHGDLQFVFCYQDGKHGLTLQPTRLQAKRSIDGYPYFDVKLTPKDFSSFPGI